MGGGKIGAFAGAVLTVETIPAVTVCEDCGQQYPTVQVLAAPAPTARARAPTFCRAMRC